MIEFWLKVNSECYAWHFKNLSTPSYSLVYGSGGAHLVYLMCNFCMHQNIIKLLENTLYLTASVVHSVVKSQVEQIMLK